MIPAANPILASITRGSRVESIHRGALAVIGPDGPRVTLGAVDQVVYPRSSLKPFQAMPVLARGRDVALGLEPREVAMLAASHSGDASHVATVRSILRKAELDERSLRCGPHPPYDDQAARDLEARGESPTALHNNCSGKHVAMLLLARELGAPLATYLELDHPAQVEIRRQIAAACALGPGDLEVGVDACSAPSFALPLEALARGMLAWAHPAGRLDAEAAACQRLFDAAVTEPHYLSGSRRIDKAIMVAAAGRVAAKSGAEGVLALAVRSSREHPPLGVALKVDDGAVRGQVPVVRELLRRLGIDLDAAAAHFPEGAAPMVVDHNGVTVGARQTGPDVAAALAALC